MAKLSLELWWAIFGLVLTIMLVVLDKAGKLKGSALLWMLLIAAMMTGPLVLGNPIVEGVSEAWKWWVRGVMMAIVGLSYWAISIWISPLPKLEPSVTENVTRAESAGRVKSQLPPLTPPETSAKSLGPRKPSPRGSKAAIPAKSKQDSSVHISSGAVVEQNGKGDCSPNIIGGSNTVICGPPPPAPLHINWAVSPIQTTDGMPYQSRVTISVDAKMSPVAIAIKCDGHVDQIQVANRNGLAATNERLFSEGNVAFVFFDGTPLMAKDELYVTLGAKKPFSIVDVGKAIIKGLND